MAKSPSKPIVALEPLSSVLATCVTFLILTVIGLFALHYALDSMPDPPQFHEEFLAASAKYRIISYLRDLAMHPNLAGTKPASLTTNYVLNHFNNLGLETKVSKHKVLLSYPAYSYLEAHFSNHTREVFRTSEPDREVVPAYHAYSPSGTVFAAAVFVNYGREEDYRVLAEAGVMVEGCVAVVRRGGISRAAVVETAERAGVAAVLMYGESDTWREGFERGNVMRRGIGDPLSPGWGGVEGGESLGLDDTEVLKKFPKIPSMPLSAEVAERILGSLGANPLPLEWKGTLKSNSVRNVGPGPTLLNFSYKGEMQVRTIENVFAVIKGRLEPDRYVLLGNHRDAWTYGAVDPSSGTATLLDVARRFSTLMRSGWTPRRTIILCSWDAEEFGMIGSTEWVEQNLVNLHNNAVAYLNVDCAAQGPGLIVGSAPQLDDLLLKVMKKVQDPDSEGTTVYENWVAAAGETSNIGRLSRIDSDFAAFVHHAGVPSTDMYYGKAFPVYHTAFDSYNWMTEFGDPFFKRHVAVAEIWGLLALHIADDSIIPFNYLSYADQLQEYNNTLSNLLDKQISLHPLTKAIQELASAAKEINEISELLRVRESTDSSVHMKLKIRALNDRLMLAEKSFLDVDGFQGRQWFKHLVFGPSNDPASKLDFFPGIADAMSATVKMSEKERVAAIQHEIWKVVRAIQGAASALRGELA